MQPKPSNNPHEENCHIISVGDFHWCFNKQILRRLKLPSAEYMDRLQQFNLQAIEYRLYQYDFATDINLNTWITCRRMLVQ
uniref:Uncharacterized protein n=1 Tax=Parascaris univalens TaxID=6257 RepID=A0A915A0S6_PARUN